MPRLTPNKCEPHCEGNRRCAETGVKERWRKNDNIYYEKNPEPFHIPWNEIIACFPKILLTFLTTKVDKKLLDFLIKFKVVKFFLYLCKMNY